MIEAAKERRCGHACTLCDWYASWNGRWHIVVIGRAALLYLQSSKVRTTQGVQFNYRHTLAVHKGCTLYGQPGCAYDCDLLEGHSRQCATLYKLCIMEVVAFQ